MEVKFETKINIETIPVVGTLLVYKTTTYKNGKLVSEQQGFVEQEKLDAMDEFGYFEPSRYNLWNKELLELHRTEQHSNKFVQIFAKRANVHPYDVIKAGGWENDYSLCMYSGYSEDFIDYDGTYEPKSMYLDYIGGLSEEHYDLERLLEYAKKHDQIKCLSDKVEPIPYYNATPEASHTVRLMLCPTKEQYNAYCKLELFDRQRAAIKLFGLDQFRID